MFIGKKYDKIEFAMAENLSDVLKEKAGKDTGLVAIKVIIKPDLIFDVEPISITPTDYLKKLGREEGITQKRINIGLKEAFEI